MQLDYYVFCVTRINLEFVTQVSLCLSRPCYLLLNETEFFVSKRKVEDNPTGKKGKSTVDS